ncbi:hypothetical protein J3A83DRAFT_4191265 [Scleroderma citrinum]
MGGNNLSLHFIAQPSSWPQGLDQGYEWLVIYQFASTHQLHHCLLVTVIVFWFVAILMPIGCLKSKASVKHAPSQLVMTLIVIVSPAHGLAPHCTSGKHTQQPEEGQCKVFLTSLQKLYLPLMHFIIPTPIGIKDLSTKIVSTSSSLGYPQPLDHAQVPATKAMEPNNLWEVLVPTAVPCTLSEVAIRGIKPSGNEASDQLLTVGFNASILSPSKYRDVEVYMSDALQHGPFLEWGDLLLMALMNGAGYDFGLPGCNMDISHCLARYGLGRSLAQAVTEQKLADFMSFVAKWCKDLCWVLERDPECGGHPPVSVVTSHQPDLAALATFCSQCLGWSMDNLRPRLMDAHTGAIIHSLLQIPGNIDGQALQNCLQVMNYCDGPLLLYEISLPHQHLPAASTDINNTHVGLSGEESDSTSLDMKVPALVLELSRPELVQGPTSSPTSQSILEGEDEGDMVIDLTFDTAYFDTGVIDLTEKIQSPNHPEKDSETYGDPGFKDAFEHKPNQCSDKALALYLSWRGFQEHCSQSTIDGIRAAFKMWWDEANGAVCHGDWHYSDVWHQWEGNPVHSAKVEDVVASIQHKISSDGTQQTHSGAMKKEYMDCILTWSQSLCLLDIPFKFVGLAMAGLESPLPGETLSNKMRNFELVKLKHRDVQFDNTAIDGMFLKYMQGEEHSLTLNDLNTYFEIHLRNRKVGTNGVLQPGIPLSHDTVQRWIDEAIVGVGISGRFSTHCFHQGGAQYQFMYAPIGQWWTLAQWDTLMCYLLDELYCYENKHSNALGPISQEADHSLASEGTLIQPASTEALCPAHASLTADVATLHASMNKMSASQAMMLEDVRDLHQKLGNMSNLLEKTLAPATAHGASPPQWSLGSPLDADNIHTSATAYQHPTSTQTSTIQLPPTIQFTPNAQSPLPTFHSQWMQFSTLLTPRTESWKDIICHWTEGEEWLSLTVPLKDWPHSWYNGPHGQKFNLKYYQRKVVATEYLDKFHENEKDFLKAYGSTARLGHTSLLKAILAAHKEYPRNGECHHHLINETQGNSSPTGSIV